MIWVKDWLWALKPRRKVHNAALLHRHSLGSLPVDHNSCTSRACPWASSGGMGQSSVGAVGNPDSGHFPLISVGIELRAGNLWWETEQSPQRKAQQLKPMNRFIMMTWPQRSKSKMWHTPIQLQKGSDVFGIYCGFIVDTCYDSFGLRFIYRSAIVV